MAIGDKYGLQAGVRALPVQDNRRLTDINPVEGKVPIRITELELGSKSGIKMPRTRKEKSVADTPANQPDDLRHVDDRVSAPYSRGISSQKTNAQR